MVPISPQETVFPFYVRPHINSKCRGLVRLKYSNGERCETKR